MEEESLEDGFEVELWVLQEADFCVAVEIFQIGNVQLENSYLRSTRRMSHLGSGSSSSRSARRLSRRFIGDSF